MRLCRNSTIATAVAQDRIARHHSRAVDVKRGSCAAEGCYTVRSHAPLSNMAARTMSLALLERPIAVHALFWFYMGSSTSLSLPRCFNFRLVAKMRLRAAQRSPANVGGDVLERALATEGVHIHKSVDLGSLSVDDCNPGVRFVPPRLCSAPDMAV